MAAGGRLCPWASWSEWDTVRQGLLGGDGGAARAAALDTVAAWRLRGRVPLGVDATATFVEASASPTTSTTTTHARRLQLAMAVVRLVNGVADAGQTRRVAASVADLAAAAGLPRTLVDLRHEATHNELPGVAALEAGAAAGLAWLRESYWRAQSDALAARFASAAALVAEYASLKLAAARSTAGADDSDGGDCDGAAQPAPPAKRRRRALLGELKDAVPPGAGRLLAAVAVSAAAGLPPPHHTTPAADRAGWRDTVAALARGWPGLRGCLAWVAVDALVAARAAAPPQNPAFAPFSATPPTPAVCVAWLQALSDAALLPADAAGAAACRAALGPVAAAAADARAAGAADAALITDAAMALAAGSGDASAPARAAGLLGVPAPTAAAVAPPPASATATVPATVTAWAHAAAWSPCPLGTLPRAGDPGGRPSVTAWSDACRDQPSGVGSRDGPGWLAAAGGAAAVAARVGLL